jgi:hypothetical protein
MIDKSEDYIEVEDTIDMFADYDKYMINVNDNEKYCVIGHDKIDDKWYRLTSYVEKKFAEGIYNKLI